MSFYSNSNVESSSKVGGLELSTIMRQVYLWVALGLLVAFGVSYWVGNAAIQAVNAQDSSFFLFNPVVSIGSIILYFVVAIALQPVIMRTSTTVGTLLYLGFTALFGFMIAGIFLLYKPGTIATAFIATSAMFGAMTIIGYTTKIDLSRMGSMLMMALLGLVIASIVNIFLRSEAVYWLISYAGVIIFVGLTAYDTQWIKNHAAEVAATGDGTMAQRIALIGAFHLFLDFMNLFLFLLRILGNSRD